MEGHGHAAARSGVRRLRLRYPGACWVCRCELARGAEAWWGADSKLLTCLVCAGSAGFSQGGAAAGASSRVRFQHLSEQRERKIKTRLGTRLGGLFLALSNEPQSIRAWRTGSEGEERLARILERELSESTVMLHDRRIPGSRANIDHVIVAANGVWVVDAKLYKGTVERRLVGPLWRREVTLFVGGRDRTALADGMRRQVAAVCAAISELPFAADIAVRAVVCFVSSDWRLFARPFEVEGVLVTRPRQLTKRIASTRGLMAPAADQIAEQISLHLPPAA